jgi:hypothetical protein
VNIEQTKNLFSKLNSNYNINYCNKNYLCKVNTEQTKNLFSKLNSNHNINYCNKIIYVK